MSLIKSHHTKLDHQNAYDQHLSMDVIKEIVTYIINKHASLIVDIEINNANPELLHHEIIRYLDETRQYHMNRDEIISDVINYMFGYGMLQPYIEDQNITDIDICRYDFILIKKHGYKEIASLQFADELEFTNFCKLIVIRNGGIINDHDCHARISDPKFRLRVNVTIAPRNVIGTSMTIRKHRMNPYDLTELVKLNMMDQKSADLLKRVMKVSSRVLVVGKGASGKTTLLRALLNEIPLTERFLVCESDSELYPDNPNFIVQKVEQQKKKKVQLQELVRDGLTMSLDGYCIGELVGSEVYEFIKAGYTDHRILGTLHALGVEETIPRIISMVEEKYDHNMIEFIGKSLDIIIYMKKFKVLSISEVIYENKLTFNELVSFDIKLETASRLEGVFMHCSDLKSLLKHELDRRYI